MEMNTGGMQYQTSFPISFAQAEPVPVTIAAQPIQTTVQAEGCKPNCNFMKRWSLLNDLRQRHEYCDLVLVSSDKVTFQAHSIILASSSSFLHTAIQTLRSESYSTSGPQKLSIDGVGSDVLGIVLDCLYGVMPSSFEGILKLRMGAEALGLNAFFWPEANKPQMQVEQTIERDPPKPKAINQYGEEEMEEGDNGKTSDGLPLALAGTTSKSRGGHVQQQTQHHPQQQPQQHSQQQPQPSTTPTSVAVAPGVPASTEQDFNPFRNMLTIESIIMGSNMPQNQTGFDQMITDPNQQMYTTRVIQPDEEVKAAATLEDHIIPGLAENVAVAGDAVQGASGVQTNTITIQNNDGTITTQQIEQLDTKTRKIKRRQSDPDQWARKQRKWKKDRGEEYITRSGKVIPAITRDGPPCSSVCPLRCSKRISIEECNDLFQMFYTLANKNKQDAYLYSLINRIEPARRTSNAPVRVRNHSFTYHIRKSDSTLIRVCKHAFSSIFGVKDSRLHRLQNHRAKPAIESTGPPVDRRGKHTNQKKIPEEIKTAVRKHILAYIAANKASGQADNALRVKAMWLDCVRVNEPQQFDIIQIGLKYGGRISQNLYKSVFCKEFKPYLDITDQKPQAPPPPPPPQQQQTMNIPAGHIIHQGCLVTQQ